MLLKSIREMEDLGFESKCRICEEFLGLLDTLQLK